MDSRERFLKACRCEPVDRPPVWLMRQAGRYLPEYREIREKYGFLEMCHRPDLAVEISLQPFRRFAMDAVIVFSDILLPAQAMGLKLSFEEGRGPRFDRRIQTLADVDQLRSPDIRRALAPTLTALSELRFQLKQSAALLGFIGAPWTVAAYMTEGGSGDFAAIQRMVRETPEILHHLLEKITPVIADYAKRQALSGADAVQVFDSWGGLLDPAAYRTWSLPFIRTICRAIVDGGAVPILFVRESSKVLAEMWESGAQVVSIGPETPMDEVLHEAQTKSIAVQGNFDPELLFGSKQEIRAATLRLLTSTADYNGVIVNLGHGVMPKTPIASVEAFVETVKRFQKPVPLCKGDDRG